MAKKAYVPDRGDIIRIHLDPQVGREQAGRRPAVVLTAIDYNRLTQLAIILPITSRAKGYPFEVPLPDDSAVTGVILVDQIKTVDWKLRNAEYAASCPEGAIHECLAKLQTLLGLG